MKIIVKAPSMELKKTFKSNVSACKWLKKIKNLHYLQMAFLKGNSKLVIEITND